MSGLAFPGAIGYGRTTAGGRGGKVYHITTLEDAAPPPPGSLRECIIASGPRIAVFDVAGNIETVKQLTVENPYLTIAGQTSQGGVCLKNGESNMDAALSIRCPQVICAGIRSAPGWGGTTRTGERQGDAVDAFGNKPKGLDVHHVYYYHCTGRWSVDEICELFGVHHVTVEGCLFAEPCNLASHSYTRDNPNVGHAKHMLAANEGAYDLSVIRTTFTRGMDRHPEIGLERGTFDLINCVIEGWGTELAQRGGRAWVTLLKDTYGNFGANLVGNHYRPGAMSDDRDRITYSHPDGAKGDGISVYLAGNLDSVLGPIDSIYHDNASGSMLLYVDFPAGDAVWGPVLSAESALTWATGALGAGASYRLDNEGKRQPCRDLADERILYNLLHSRGSLINHPDEVGGWPAIVQGEPLDWIPGPDGRDVPRAFAEMYPDATVDDYLWM